MEYRKPWKFQVDLDSIRLRVLTLLPFDGDLLGGQIWLNKVDRIAG